MANIKVLIDPKKVKKDGECTVYLVVNLQYKKLWFSTDVSCSLTSFNLEDGKINGASKKVKDDNLIIGKCLAAMNDIFVRYRLQNVEITPDLLRQEWKNPSRRIDFYAFFEEMMKLRRGEIAEGTRKQHESSINKLKEFRPKLNFTEITVDFLDDYKRWLRVTKKNEINTVHTALKNLKTYVNMAKRKGVIEACPFDHYHVAKQKSGRTYLVESELQSLWTLYLRDFLNETDQLVLRHFLFMCMTGLRISDFKAIEEKNVIANTLEFIPVKTVSTTKEKIKLPLNSYAKKLIADEKSKIAALFNPISEGKMNLKIKEIIKVAKPKIHKDISLHCARHTFATIWLNKTKDIVGLQKILGHADIKQTMIYVHVTDQMVADEMSRFDRLLFTDTKANHLMAIT